MIISDIKAGRKYFIGCTQYKQLTKRVQANSTVKLDRESPTK